MTITTTRLRELIHEAEDRERDTSQSVGKIRDARDTAVALRELLHLRGKLVDLLEAGA